MKGLLYYASRTELAFKRQTANCQKRLKALEAQRHLLFEHFSKNSQQISLALDIKRIDDQIAECNEQIRQLRKGGWGPKVSP